MAINSKGSRKIVVGGVEFRWRATGHDDGISITIWPRHNDVSIILARIGYHSTPVPNALGGYSVVDHLVVTNRLIRRIILHYGVDFMLVSTKKIDVGHLEEIAGIGDVVRAGDGSLP